MSFIIYPFSRTANSVADILVHNYARALLGQKKLGSCSVSFLVHLGRSPGMMLLCLSASWIYNKFSIATRSRKRRITRAVQTDDNFFRTDSLSRSNRYQIFGISLSSLLVISCNTKFAGFVFAAHNASRLAIGL